MDGGRCHAHRDGRRTAPSSSPARNMHRLGLLRWRRSADVPLSDAGGLNPDVTTLLEAANFSTAVVALATTEPLPRCSRVSDPHRTQCWERYVARPSTRHFVLSCSRWTSRHRRFVRKNTPFRWPRSQYLVECSRARQDVLVRSGHGAGRARMRVPTCSARPAPRYAVLYRFHFSARRAPARGVGDFFFGNQSGVLHRTPTGRLGALYRAPIRGPGRLYYVSKVDTVYRNSIPVLRWRPLT